MGAPLTPAANSALREEGIPVDELVEEEEDVEPLEAEIYFF